MKGFKQRPIDKKLIKQYQNKLFIPYFIEEEKWIKINTHSWFDCLIYKYKIKKRIYHNLCGIDIGCKNFLTIYGSNGVCYRIIANEEKIDKILQSNDLTYLEKDQKIYNMINDLHIQSARLICNSFRNIYVGQIHTKDNIDSKNMKTITDNLTSILLHNKFLQILTKFAIKKKRNLHIVDESFTSKHCGICGEIKHKFKRIQFGTDSERRQYICEFCGNILHRDINASRLIIIKNL